MEDKLAMKNKKEILIDLSKHDYSDAVVCSEYDLIHIGQMERIRKIWSRLYMEACNAENYNVSNEHLHCHNTISIFASRGAGKTTFLHSFLAEIKKNDSNVLCLKIFDPSLSERKQHPFINIIARIHQAVKEHRDLSKRIDCRNKEFNLYKSYMDSHQELLSCLPFIDGIGKDYPYADWDDEEFIAVQGMKKAEMSNLLDEKFAQYIMSTLKLLDKKCIVIPFDDIDTDFKDGFKILEIIRRYLNIPQLIPILTGDLDLYGKLVRKAQWDYFSSTYLKKEIDYAGRKHDEFATMINQLENQYVVKLLKQENRVHLKNLNDNLEDDSLKIMIRFTDLDKNVSIKEAYRRLVALLGFRAISDEIINYLLRLSLRVQMRILTLMNTVYSSYEKGYVSKEEAYSEISYRLFDIFRNDVNQKASNAKRLMKQNSSCYVMEMLCFLMNSRSLYVGTSFLPETNDHVLNKALFAVGFFYNNLANKHNYYIFDYWLRISHFKTLSELIGGDTNSTATDSLFKYAQLDSEKEISNSIGLGHAYINAFLNYKQEKNGVHHLTGTIPIKETVLSFSTMKSVYSQLPLVGTVGAYNNSSTFISIYKLLAAIQECLVMFQNFTQVKEEHFKISIFRLSQYNYYPEPVEGQEFVEEEIKSLNWVNDIQFEKNDQKILTDLYESMLEWSADKSIISAELLNRIFTRFYHTMFVIDKSTKYKTIGDKFSAYITALLNSSLVECAIDRLVPDIELNNVGDIEQIFIRNVNSLSKSQSTKLELYDWLLNCPLLKAYMNPFLMDLVFNKQEDKKQSLVEVMNYHNICQCIDSIQKEFSSLERQSTQLGYVQTWIINYKQKSTLKIELDLYIRLVEVAKTDINKYYDLLPKIDEIRNNIASLETELKKSIYFPEKNIELTSTTSIEVVDKVEKQVNERIENLRYRMNLMKKDLTTLIQARDSKASFIKEDYEKRMARVQEREETAYHSLCEIII